MCHYGAFVNTSDKFQIDLGQVKKESKTLAERLLSYVTYVSKEAHSHIWDSIICPVTTSLIKQLDSIV
jgi:hypothetical protein